MAVAIEIKDVSKKFRLHHEKHSTLKEKALKFGRTPYDDFWALKNINLEIQEGQTFGLLSHNGSGKSTLLKCMAGILQPTSGQIKVKGRLAAMLELGAGFHSDLSGRDNIFLNASLLGLSKKEIEKRFDDIVAFSELEQFIDNQVKFYSSGMYVRLGFAVAVNMDPDVLLVDEVLAVGDENFQRKCLDRIKVFQKEGRTIVFVTHGADMVRQICDEAMVLDHGLPVVVASPGKAVREFREHLLRNMRYEEAVQLPESDNESNVEVELGQNTPEDTKQIEAEQKANFKIKIQDIEIIHDHLKERKYILSGEDFTVRVSYEAKETIEDLVIGIAIYDLEGYLVFGSNTDFLGMDVSKISKEGFFDFSFNEVPLLDGTYMITIGLHNTDGGVVYDWWEQRAQFEVMFPGRSAGLVKLPLSLTLHSKSDFGIENAKQQSSTNSHFDNSASIVEN